MTIALRIEDAEFLWQAGRHEGALLSALVAFAATSRRVLPRSQEKKDAVAFRKLFNEQLSSGWTVSFRGEMTSMDELFYKWLRCELVHEGGLPVGLSFDHTDSDGLVTVALQEGYPLAVSAGWYHSLVLAVIDHRINADVFPDQETRVAEAVKNYRTAGIRLMGKFAYVTDRQRPASTLSSKATTKINLAKDY